MDSKLQKNPNHIEETVSKVELNSWRRGFTPQAEIWNGRMAMFALIVVMTSLATANLLYR
tara:strand:+ start:629 stop:808 length:180 start_codon:yes stop_codon:yes gene_type:complete